MAQTAIMVCCVGVLVLLFAEWKQLTTLRAVAKIVASAAFVSVPLLSESPFSVPMFAALVASFWGDVALIGKKTMALAIGIGFFLCAHAGYSIAFVERGVSASILVGAAVPLSLVLVLLFRRFKDVVPKKLFVPVVIYAAAVSTMLACAIATSDLVVAVAAISFYVSDLAVARQRFVTPSMANKLIGLPLYYAAQLMFAKCS